MKKPKKVASNSDLALKYIIAYLPGHVYWKDKNGVYLGCNDKQAISLGMKSGSEIIGKTDFELPWSKGFAKTFRKNDLQVMRSAKPQIFEEISNVDGKQVAVLTHKVPLQNEKGSIIGILGISLDFSERKMLAEKLKIEAERAVKANKSKSEFIRLMSHELNSPLNAISMLSDICKKEKNEAVRNDFLDKMKEEVFVTVEMIKNVRQLIKIQDHDVPSTIYSCNVYDLANKLMPFLPQKERVNLQIKINKAIPERIWLDESNVLNILEIVTSNAFKHTSSGVITLDFKHFEETQAEVKHKDMFATERGFLQITVTDTGAGISKRELKTIFTTFTKPEDMGEDLYRKTGIKLPLAKAMAEMLKGSLTLKSTQGKGTTVTIKIPYLIPHMSKDSSMVKKVLKMEPLNLKKLTASSPMPRPCKVLLIEDDPLSLMAEKLSLEHLNATVDAALEARSALELIKKGNVYDFILVDITLPGMDGVELTRNIQKLVTYEPTFIAVTSHSSDEDGDRYAKAGIYAMIPKPVTLEKLKSTLYEYQKAIRKSQQYMKRYPLLVSPKKEKTVKKGKKIPKKKKARI